MSLSTQNANKFLINDETKMQLLKDVFFKGATNDEFMLFAHACERTGLDPFMRQIYPVKRWDSTLKKEAMTVQTGIDGYRLIAERTACYAPGKEPTFTYNKEGKLLCATAYVKKFTNTDGSWHEIAASAFYEEYCQRTKEGNPTSMWQKMPHSQLAKCAEALALRKAFPTELSGLYTKEEMEQSEVNENKKIESVPTITPAKAIELKEILDRCSPEYKNQVIITLKKSSIDNLEDIPINLYERIKLAAIKKKEEFYLECSQEESNYEMEESNV